LSDGVRIGNSAPLPDPQTQRKNCARNERKMRILHVPKQKFRPGVHKDDAHDHKMER
jgi:hypothetical protein